MYESHWEGLTAGWQYLLFGYPEAVEEGPKPQWALESPGEPVKMQVPGFTTQNSYSVSLG